MINNQKPMQFVIESLMLELFDLKKNVKKSKEALSKGLITCEENTTHLCNLNPKIEA